MGSTLSFIIAILSLSICVFLAILWTGKRGHHFNVEYYQTHFLQIENKLRKDNPTSFCIVVIECDKLLDKAMIEIGASGKTMGDRLKSFGNHFSNLNAVWNAHKLRNYIAHETDTDISYMQARNAIEAYKQALKDLGAI